MFSSPVQRVADDTYTHTHTHTYTYQRYIVGKVHCGENLCVLVGVVGKIHTYVQMIHCGESALWGKSVRPIVGVVGKIHTYVQMIHCGESALWGKSVHPSWCCGEKFRFPTRQILFPHSAMFWCASLTSERRILKAIRRTAYRYTDQSHTCSRITHARTIYRSCT